MRRVNFDEYEFSTGLRFHANRGLIGLAENGPAHFEVVHGYDGHVGAENWTPEECADLADYMIGQWQMFKAKALK